MRCPHLWLLPALLALLPGLAMAQRDPLAGEQIPPVLDEDVLKRLEETGLVVLPDQAQTNLYSCYYGLQQANEPIYVTSDAMLYLWYEAHREAVMAAEAQWLHPQLLRLTEGLLAATQRLRAEEDDPDLRANAVMLEVAWTLLDPSHEPALDLAAEVSPEAARVREAAQVGRYPGEDYTQYRVRGHYTRSRALGDYFRGAKYLARRYFRVADPNFPADAERELRRGLLLALALRSDPALVDLYREIARVRTALVGPVDSIGLDQALTAAEAVWGPDWGRDNLADLGPVRAKLTGDRYPRTRIHTRVTDPDFAVMPPWNIALLGEHYVPDSDLFHHTTEPRVPFRHLPSGLDVATALGSSLAAEKLREQAASFPEVTPNAVAFGQEMSLEGVYGSWMATLRTLFEQPEEGLPDFARSRTYQAKQLNCALTSWAHLRHNYILYGAHAYTAMGRTSPPPGLVEPLPGFWAAYARMCGELREMLADCGVEGRPLEVLDLLAEEADVFRRCAEDQLAGRDISWARGHITGFAHFIARVYFDSPLVVADVATSSETYEVLHAGSGPFRPVLVRYLVDDTPVIAQGWVGSYYEWPEPEMGRLTDEEWQARFQREYDVPAPPEWLAELYAEDPGAGTEQRARLREIEALLAEGRYEEAERIGEAFIEQEAEAEWAPAAVLLLGEYLRTHGRAEEGIAMLERARAMYGCEARDRALQIVRSYRPGPQTWAERLQERERRFQEELAATDPREGLSEEEEIRRQDRRALLLLKSVTGWYFPDARDWEARLTQVLDECPRSGYVPAAEFFLAQKGLFANVQAVMHYMEGRPPAPEGLEEMRAELLRLADKYADSAVSMACRALAAGALLWLDKPEEAYREVRPLLDMERPDPEPYPLSVHFIESDEFRYLRMMALDAPASEVAKKALLRLMPDACRAADLERVREYLDLSERHGLIRYDGSWDDLVRIVNHLDGEDDGLRAMLSHGLVTVAGSEPPVRTAAERAEWLREGLEIADRLPDSKTAPAVLHILWSRARHRAEHEELLQEVVRRLSEQYPDSLENLVAQTHLAAQREDEAAYERLMAEISARVPDFQYHLLDTPTHAQDLAARARRIRPPGSRVTPEVVAQWREVYGEFITAARLSDDDLVNFGHSKGLVEDLIKRLPEREAEIVLTHARHAGSYIAAHALGEAIDRRPDSPLILELRFARGTLADLAEIIASGPDAPHYAEAVEKFEAFRPSDDRRKVERDLYPYRVLARRHAGTAVEPLACATMAAIYLHHERPERALELVTEQLVLTPEDRPFRDRLLVMQENAEREIAIKRAGAHPPLWTAPVDSSAAPNLLPNRDVRLEPVLDPDGDRLYAAGRLSDNRTGIIALDTATGARVWEAPCPAPISLACAGGGLIFTTGDGAVGRLERADGRRAWEKPLGLSRSGRAWAVADGDLLVAAWDQGLLLRLDPETGEVLWQRDEPVCSLVTELDRGLTMPLVLCGDMVVAWDLSRDLRAWRASDGEPAWTLTHAALTGREDEDVPAHRRLPPPVACGDRIVVRVGQPSRHAVVAVDLSGGEVYRHTVSRSDLRVYVPPRNDPGGTLYLHADGRLTQWAAADGSRRWSLPTQRERIRRAPIIATAGEYVLVVTHEIAAVDRGAGRVVARQPLDNVSVRTACAATEPGSIRAFVTTDRDIRAYEMPLGP